MSASGQPDPSKRSRGLAGVVLRCEPDVRLTSLARHGCEGAFEEISRRYRTSLTTFAASIVPASRAEDVVQDAFVKAYRSLPNSDDGLRLRPWLYTIVRNTALNNLRDERDHERLNENWDGVPQPPEIAARRAEFAALVRRIEHLPAPQREALVRRELEGRSHEEIATTLGTTPGAVRALIFRARTALRAGAGMLIPLPAFRALLPAGSMQVETAGAGVGAAGLAGGGGLALKAGAGLVALALAVGSGVAIHGRAANGGRDSEALPEKRTGVAATGPGSMHKRHIAGSPGSSGRGWDSRPGPGHGSSRGPRGADGASGSSGSGSGGSASRGRADSGPGGDPQGRSGSEGDGSDEGSGSGSPTSLSGSAPGELGGGDGSRSGTTGSGGASGSETSGSEGTSGSGTNGSGRADKGDSTSASGGDDGSSTSGSSGDSTSGSSGSGISGGGSATEVSATD